MGGGYPYGAGAGAGYGQPAAASRSQGPLIAGIVAGVVVLALVIAGVLVAVSGGDDDDTQNVTADGGATTTVVTAPRALIPQETLYGPISGYTVEPLPEGLLNVVRSPFDNLPELKGLLRDLSGRQLTRNSTVVAQVFVYQFKQDLASAPGAAEGFRAGFGQLATETQDTTVAGVEALYYRLSNGITGLASLQGDNALVVQGTISRSQLNQVFTAMAARV